MTNNLRVVLLAIPLILYTGYLYLKSNDQAESGQATKNLMALVQTNKSRLFGPEDKQAAVVKRMLEEEQIAVYARLGGATTYIPLTEMQFLERPLQLIEIHPYELTLFLERQEGQKPLSVSYPQALEALHCTSQVSALPPPESQTEFVYCE